ncbi:MAG: hypothetical protein LUG89_05910, partial [Methanosphaera sp.]|nr:hypothetical protein [Methanosphaera sp.]
KLNIFYFKIIILDYIKKDHNLYKLDNELPIRYNITNIGLIVNELIEDECVKISNPELEGVIINMHNVMLLKYDITLKGLQFLKNNTHVFPYNYYVKNSIVDDIITFDSFKNKNYEPKQLLIEYINKKREEYIAQVKIELYLATFNLEAYVYENLEEYNNHVLTLLKRFIVGINLPYDNMSLKPVDEDFINYFKIVINNLDEVIDTCFDEAYNFFGEENLLFNHSETLDLFIKAMNSNNIEKVNDEVFQLYTEKINIY